MKCAKMDGAMVFDLQSAHLLQPLQASTLGRLFSFLPKNVIIYRFLHETTNFCYDSAILILPLTENLERDGMMRTCKWEEAMGLLSKMPMSQQRKLLTYLRCLKDSEDTPLQIAIFPPAVQTKY